MIRSVIRPTAWVTGITPLFMRNAMVAKWSVAALVLLLGLGLAACSRTDERPPAPTSAPADDKAAPLPTPSEAKPVPELDALFERHEPWIGADGVYSVVMTPRRSLWLFSDTWVGRLRDGKRTDAVLVNNSVAVQDGRGTDARLTFAVRTGPDHKPAAVIAPIDERGWFWPQAGVIVGDRLYVFLAQMEKTKEPGAFGFRAVARQLGVIANPDDVPTDWRVSEVKLPFTDIGPKREITFGSAVLRDGDDLYVYGIDEDVKPGGKAKHLIVARVPAAQVADMTAWRFFHDGNWQKDFEVCDRLADGLANEFSVSYLPARHCYALVYTENGLSPRIVARTAAKPWGPWSAPTLLYECPEMAKHKGVFCYAAKAHLLLAADDELVVSYVVNAYDLWGTLADARLYWPRFVRVKFAAGASPP